VIYDQKLQQQEQRLVRVEQMNTELASQMQDLKSVTSQTRQEVQVISFETKQELQALTAQVKGQDNVLQRILHAVEGRGPSGGETRNI
jgi:hypothetical protein